MLTRTVLAGLLACTALVATAGCASQPGAPAAHHPSGKVYTDTAGQFRARFPAKPTYRQEPGSLGGTGFIVYVAVTKKPSPMEVGVEVIGTPVPSTQFRAQLGLANRSFAAAIDLTARKDLAIRFDGHVARQTTLVAPNGKTYTLMSFFYTGTRLYFLFASAGERFNGLARSFVALN